jgi:OTU domain-containing protein 6
METEKEIRARIQNLKKIGKSDKSKKKETQLEIQELEEKIKNLLDSKKEIVVESDDKKDRQSIGPSKKTLRLEKKKKAMDILKLEAEEEAKNSINYREEEEKALSLKLASKNLKIFPINADGHCLYSSISHQLTTIKNEEKMDYMKLRSIAANHLRKNVDEYIAFADLEDCSFEDYCKKVEGSGEWGSHLEITAIAKELNLCIEIFQAKGENIIIGEQNDKGDNMLKISYHQHYFGLGEHYNSLI